MSVKNSRRPRPKKCQRCSVCGIWRPIKEMITDSDICRADDPSETPVLRFWECRTHTKKQDDRLIARLRELWPDIMGELPASTAHDLEKDAVCESMNVEAMVESQTRQ